MKGKARLLIVDFSGPSADSAAIVSVAVGRSLARSLSLQNGLVNVRTDISTMGGWVANSLTDTALRTTVDFAES